MPWCSRVARQKENDAWGLWWHNCTAIVVICTAQTCGNILPTANCGTKNKIGILSQKSKVKNALLKLKWLKSRWFLLLLLLFCLFPLAVTDDAPISEHTTMPNAAVRCCRQQAAHKSYGHWPWAIGFHHMAESGGDSSRARPLGNYSSLLLALRFFALDLLESFSVFSLLRLLSFTLGLSPFSSG